MSLTPNDKFQFILGRRSIRVYAPGEVNETAVTHLLHAAMAAPSALCPWRFVVIRKKETLSTIATALPNGNMLATAPLGIVVCGDLDAAHDRQLSYLLQDCSAAIENLLLCAMVLVWAPAGWVFTRGKTASGSSGRFFNCPRRSSPSPAFPSAIPVRKRSRAPGSTANTCIGKSGEDEDRGWKMEDSRVK